MHIRFHDAIAELPAAEWDALRAEANPFVSHAFLHALERSGCIRPDWGWQAHHLGLYEDGRLRAAAPLYQKGNSHGEFVLDWGWARAWERAGGTYYPKLHNGVPLGAKRSWWRNMDDAGATAQRVASARWRADTNR